MAGISRRGLLKTLLAVAAGAHVPSAAVAAGLSLPASVPQTTFSFDDPPPDVIAGAAAVGLLGYGTSLVLFVLALRHLGTSRTGAYFSTAPRHDH